ncbi:MAG: hypothetical protein AAF684_07570 [Pseudomonadota bacterium]
MLIHAAGFAPALHLLLRRIRFDAVGAAESRFHGFEDGLRRLAARRARSLRGRAASDPWPPNDRTPETI